MTVSLDIVIPVYNEDLDVVRATVSRIRAAFGEDAPASIVLVDDGSDSEHSLAELEGEAGVRVLRHEENLGYGAALKTGIRAGTAPLIAITDADGTYPVEELPAMLAQMEGAEMVIGVRTGDVQQIPRMRRFPKTMLNAFASYMSGRRIPDVNSGLRIFRRDLCLSLWGLYPQGFSFTSTLTMGAMMGGHRVRSHVINYFKRQGKSSIQPIKDTIRFFFIVMRLGLLFSPMKIFGPMAAALFVVGALKGFVRDFILLGYVGNLAVMLMIAAVQVFMMGLLGEMIVHSRNLRASFRETEDGLR